MKLDRNGLPAGKPAFVAPSTRMDQFPSFSPDGQKIAFESNRNGSNEIWIADLNGSAAQAATSLRANSERPRWSPDGTAIAFESNVSGAVKIYVVAASSGRLRRITDGGSIDKHPTWSEDGLTLYFGSNRGGLSAIYRVAATGGPVQLMTAGPVNYTDPALFGGFLYFTEREQNESVVWRISLKSGEKERVTGDVFYDDYWPSRRGLYYSSETSGRERLLLLRPRAPNARLALVLDEQMDNPVVSPDGSQLVFSTIEDWSKNLFFSKLTR